MDVARETITDAYRAEQQKLHGNKRYGVASLTYAPLVSKLLKIGKCHSLSDYGAGKCNLKVALGLSDGGPVAYQPYDPAFPAYGPPRPADLVTCIDVLEHIEPELLGNVLDELSSITRRLAFLTVHTRPAKKVLSDGRNAHLIQEPPSWWIDRLTSRFEILHLQAVPKGFFVIAGAKHGYADLASSVDLEELGRVAGRARVRRKGLKRLLKALVGR
jgi:hypothetical protein